MPNLLSINNYHYRRGGSDVVYFDHAELMSEEGWANTFFSMKHPRNLPDPNQENFIDLVDWEFRTGLMGDLTSAGRSIYNWQARTKIEQLCRQNRFDIAHVHCAYHHITPSIFPILKKYNIPIVLTAHDLKMACPAYKMMNNSGICERCKGGALSNVIKNRCIKESFIASSLVFLEAKLHQTLKSYEKNISAIVTPSRFYRDKLVQWGVDPKKIRHIGNFVKPIPERFCGSYDGNILYFGRIAQEKGLKTLIDASLASQVPVDIVGTGPQLSEIEQYIKINKAPVRLVGRLDGDELWKIVGQARGVVVPSEWYENNPMSALEAMTLQRPIIGARIGGIPEIVKHESSGFLYEAFDSLKLANCLEKISLMTGAQLKSMGQQGRSIVMSEFSRSAYKREMQNLYGSLLNGEEYHG